MLRLRIQELYVFSAVIFVLGAIVGVAIGLDIGGK